MNIVGGLVVLGFIAAFLGLAGSAALIFALVYGGRRAVYALKGQPYRPLLGPGKQAEYQHQDVDNGADLASVRTILKNNLQTYGASPYARAGLNALESADRKAASFMAVLDAKFQAGSITWSKFAGAADITKEGVLRKCAELANAIQVFDHADYKRLETSRRRSTFRHEYQLDDTQQEQYRLLKVKLGEMDSLVGDCEKLLLELDKLTAELDKLDDAGSSDESERLINEIRTLSDETKYYKQKLDEMDNPE